MLLAPVQAAPIPLGPGDFIGFDYEMAEFVNAQVTHFERKSGTGAWADIGIPPVVAGAPAGWNTYQYIPGAPFDVPTTILFRACNVGGCGATSDPFTFVRVSTSQVLSAPSNVRKIGGT